MGVASAFYRDKPVVGITQSVPASTQTVVVALSPSVSINAKFPQYVDPDSATVTFPGTTFMVTFP